MKYESIIKRIFYLIGHGTIMVLNHIDTPNNNKNSYNMNTKTKGKAAEIPQSHLSFEEFE